jgi:hypothetical protein
MHSLLTDQSTMIQEKPIWILSCVHPVTLIPRVLGPNWPPVKFSKDAHSFSILELAI